MDGLQIRVNYAMLESSTTNRGTVMSRKLIASVGHGGVMVKVYRDSDWNKYRIRLYRNGHVVEIADAFESDKQAALDTMQAMLAWELRDVEG